MTGNRSAHAEASFLSVAEAQHIMGLNVILPGDLLMLGIHLSPRRLAALSRVPFSRQQLSKYAQFGSGILVPSIAQNKSMLQGCVTDQLELGWYLVSNSLLPGSSNLTYKAQCQLLAKNQIVPSVLLLHHVGRLWSRRGGQPLFRGNAVRTSTFTLKGEVATIVFREKSKVVTYRSPEERNPDLWLATEEVPEDMVNL
jgi:hypothetical protein